MAKKKQRKRVGGHPARRAQQKVEQKLKARERSLEALLREGELQAKVERDMLAHHVRPLEGQYYDDEAHNALTERGWRSLSRGRSTAPEADAEDDEWDWVPSQVEPDYDAELYYETTLITPRPVGLVVDLASGADGPFAGAIYTSLEDLLVDLQHIEDYRLGDDLKQLHNAATALSDLPGPLSTSSQSYSPGN